MMTSIPLVDEAERMGAEHGTAAGSWVVDGNSSAETLRAVIDAVDGEGDPLDIPSPLSGEYADDPTPRTVLEALGVDEDDPRADDLLWAYEDAYYQAFRDEALRSAMLPEEEGEETP